MLAEPKLKQLLDLVGNSGKEELIWMNGYISGLINQQPVAAPATAAVASQKITVVYGTETGNAKKLATDLASKAKKRNIPVKLAGLDQYRLTDLGKEENLFVVISTQGDGEPPVAAQKFYDHIHRNGFRLDNLKYSVLALGDTSYPLFCKTGEDVDAQLHKLGGKRIIPVKKCDVDYEADAADWFEQVLSMLGTQTVQSGVAVKPAAQIVTSKAKKIYEGKVLSSVNMNDRGSAKETYHIELSVEGVEYEPGDSIAVIPQNPLQTVDAIIARLGVSGEAQYTYKDSTYTISELIKNKLNIFYLHERVIRKYADISGQEIPEVKMDLLDLLTIYPVKENTDIQTLIGILPAQAPRIYNIGSAPSVHTDEIHLTVAKEFYEINGQQRTGLCSAYLAELKESDTLSFFVQKNKRFRLPAADQDIIMVTPGTGVAALRSFISERDATGATGRNWLFFGSDYFATDFLYQTEIQNWYQTGVLTNVNLAFSKDKPYGLSVWHKIIENGKELFNWIDSGARLYVCGEKEPMAVEVEKALLQVIETWSGLSASDTQAYFEKMKDTVLYSKDVY